MNNWWLDPEKYFHKNCSFVIQNSNTFTIDEKVIDIFKKNKEYKENEKEKYKTTKKIGGIYYHDPINSFTIDYFEIVITKDVFYKLIIINDVDIYTNKFINEYLLKYIISPYMYTQYNLIDFEDEESGEGSYLGQITEENLRRLKSYIEK